MCLQKYDLVLNLFPLWTTVHIHKHIFKKYMNPVRIIKKCFCSMYWTFENNSVVIIRTKISGSILEINCILFTNLLYFGSIYFLKMKQTHVLNVI